jgi:hypothetical protein
MNNGAILEFDCNSLGVELHKKAIVWLSRQCKRRVNVVLEPKSLPLACLLISMSRRKRGGCLFHHPSSQVLKVKELATIRCSVAHGR